MYCNKNIWSKIPQHIELILKKENADIVQNGAKPYAGFAPFCML